MTLGSLSILLVLNSNKPKKKKKKIKKKKKKIITYLVINSLASSFRLIFLTHSGISANFSYGMQCHIQ
jgi:hypothetical protein